jgi:hypothetical protein
LFMTIQSAQTSRGQVGQGVDDQGACPCAAPSHFEGGGSATGDLITDESQRLSGDEDLPDICAVIDGISVFERAFWVDSRSVETAARASGGNFHVGATFGSHAKEPSFQFGRSPSTFSLMGSPDEKARR